MLLKMFLALIIGCFISTSTPSTAIAYHEIGGESEDSVIDFIPEPSANTDDDADDAFDFEENEDEDPVRPGNYRD